MNAPRRRGIPPINPLLDLWSLGHSARQIAEMLGLPNGKHVERIIAKARLIGDPRAVRHATGGRVMGKGLHHGKRDVAERSRGYEVVPLVLKARCLRGHPRVPENLTSGGHCLTCRREVWEPRRSKVR